MTVLELAIALNGNSVCTSFYTSMSLMDILGGINTIPLFNVVCQESADDVEADQPVTGLSDAEALKQGIKKFKLKFDDKFIEYWDNL